LGARAVVTAHLEEPAVLVFGKLVAPATQGWEVLVAALARVQLVIPLLLGL
jgi:hypothetical protein